MTDDDDEWTWFETHNAEEATEQAERTAEFVDIVATEQPDVPERAPDTVVCAHDGDAVKIYDESAVGDRAEWISCEDRFCFEIEEVR